MTTYRNQWTGRRSLADRFWEKVEKTDGCWLWTASLNGGGYGTINAGGRGRPLLAPRVSWELHNGPILDGLFVCHHCDNRRCVRPDHLFLGSAIDNMQDMKRKGRHVGNRKITRQQVAEIRRLYAAGGISQEKLGERFGITQGAVWLIVNNKRHLMPGDQQAAMARLDEVLAG
jgi:hypothetical protein